MNIVPIPDDWKKLRDLKLAEMEQRGESPVVAPGVSGLPELRYCQRRQKLHYVDPEKVRKLGKRNSRPTKTLGSSPAVQARRKTVAQMHSAGRTISEIADAFGVSDDTIRRDANYLGLTFEKRAFEKHADRVRRESKLAVAKAYKSGMTLNELMEASGRSQMVVRRCIGELDIEVLRNDRKGFVKPPASIAAE